MSLYIEADYIEDGYIGNDANMNGIFLYPDWDEKYEGRKIEFQHRTRAGEMYRHTVGHYDRIVMNLSAVTSADACAINSLWAASAPVVYYNADGVVVISGYIVNATSPIARLVKPYTDLFMGTIELEEY